MPLINLAFPANALKLSLILMSIANFDVLPHTKMNNFLFSFNRKDQENEVRYQNLGFETYNFVLNAGSTFWLMIFWAVSAAFILGLNFLCKSKKNRAANGVRTLYGMLFYGLLIRLFLESYIELMVSAMLNL